MKKIHRIVLGTLVVGLTLISLIAGFDFYRALFGRNTALLICILFEILRLVCLYALISNQILTKTIALPLYILIAGTCAFVAVTSFHADINSAHNKAQAPFEKEILRRIAVIKQAYAQKATKDIENIIQKIDVCNRKLAWNEHSVYWQKRLTQLQHEKELLIQEQDSFLKFIPELGGDEQWIANQAARLNLVFEQLPKASTGSHALTGAIQELWGVTTLNAKRIIGAMVVMITEIGILVLSLLLKNSVVVKSSVTTQKLVVLNKENNYTIKNIAFDQATLDELRLQFSEKEIDGFMKRCERIIEKQGRMPYARELGKRQREIREFIIKISQPH